MNVNKKNRFGGIKRGHACEFTIQLQSLTCLIQQQQQSRKSMLSGLKIANNINQMIEAINDRVLGESDSAPRTGVLQKKIVISWKRGHKKGGKIATATFNPTTNEYDFDRVSTPMFSFVATMEPLSSDKLPSNPSTLIEQSWKQKQLKITIEEFVDDQFKFIDSQLATNLLNKKICSHVYDLSDCFTQMKQRQQKLGEQCTATLPMMTLTNKSFAKVVPPPIPTEKKRLSLFSKTPLFSRSNSSGKMTTSANDDSENTLDLSSPTTGGLLLLKMNIEPKFTDMDEETVDSDTVVSVDNILTEEDDTHSDLEEDDSEMRLRSTSSSSAKSLRESQSLLDNAMTRSVSLDMLASRERANSDSGSIPISGSPDMRSMQTKEKLSISPRNTGSPSISFTSDTGVISPLSDKLQTKRSFSLFDSIKKSKQSTNEDTLSRMEALVSENKELKEKLQGAEQALVQYKLQVESLLSREAENSQSQKSAYESRIQVLNDNITELQQKVSDLESSNSTLSEERLNLSNRIDELNEELSRLNSTLHAKEEECREAMQRESSTKEEQNKLSEKLSEMENVKQKLDEENKNLQNDVQKMRIRIKHQEAQLLSAEEAKKEQVVSVQLKPVVVQQQPEDFHPAVTAIAWGFICTFCIILAFPFIHQVLASLSTRSSSGRTLEDELETSEYIFRHGLACFGVITLFSTFGLKLARQLNMHMNGTYLMKTVRSILLVQNPDISMFSFDNQFIENAKSSCLWGLCLGLVMKFIDWLFFFRWIIPSTSLVPFSNDNSSLAVASPAVSDLVADVALITNVALWKRLFYSLYCAVSDELIGRLFLFLFLVEVARRVRVYLIQQKDNSNSHFVVNTLKKYGRQFLTLSPIDIEGAIKNYLNIEPNAEQKKPADDVPVDESVNATVTMNGRVNGVIITAMIIASILFALTKCPWEMTMYPPTNLFMWSIALVRCIVIHGLTSLIYCYMFFVQQNIEFVILAHAVTEFVFYL